jgi:hypothetical protein
VPPEAGRRKRRLDLNVPQVAGSAVASVVAAKFASNLGVYGTILGAGVVSAIATFSGSVFQHFFRRTGEQIRDAAVQARPRARQVPVAMTSSGHPVPETFLSGRGTAWPPGGIRAVDPVTMTHGAAPGADATMALYAADSSAEAASAQPAGAPVADPTMVMPVLRRRAASAMPPGDRAVSPGERIPAGGRAWEARPRRGEGSDAPPATWGVLPGRGPYDRATRALRPYAARVHGERDDVMRALERYDAPHVPRPDDDAMRALRPYGDESVALRPYGDESHALSHDEAPRAPDAYDDARRFWRRVPAQWDAAPGGPTTALPGAFRETTLPGKAFTEGTVHRARMRGVKRPLLAAVLVFVVTMSGITAYELASGHSFSGADTGTTIGDLFTGGGHSGRGDTPATPSVTPSEQSSHGPSDQGRQKKQNGNGGAGASPSQTPGGNQSPEPTPDPTGTHGSGAGPDTGPASGTHYTVPAPGTASGQGGRTPTPSFSPLPTQGGGIGQGGGPGTRGGFGAGQQETSPGW